MKKCVLCQNEIKGYGSSPYPLADKGKCCQTCDNNHVKPVKMALGGVSPSEIRQVIKLETELIQNYYKGTKAI